MTTWACMLCHEANPHRRRDICDDCDAWLTAQGNAWCSKCRRRIKQTDKSPGTTWCRACKRESYHKSPCYTKRGEYAKAWRARNAEKIKAYNARPDVRAAQNESRKRVYRRNIDAERAWQRAYAQRTREQKIAYAREWRKNNPDYGARRYRLKKLAIIRAALGGSSPTKAR